MPDRKQPETPAERTARLQRIEAEAKAILDKPGIAPRTPKEAKEIHDMARRMDAAEERYLKSLMKPKDKGDPRGR